MNTALKLKKKTCFIFTKTLTVTSQIIIVLSFDPVASFVPSRENRRNQTCKGWKYKIMFISH